jgi:hypothetical protein
MRPRLREQEHREPQIGEQSEGRPPGDGQEMPDRRSRCRSLGRCRPAWIPGCLPHLANTIWKRLGRYELASPPLSMEAEIPPPFA